MQQYPDIINLIHAKLYESATVFSNVAIQHYRHVTQAFSFVNKIPIIERISATGSNGGSASGDSDAISSVTNFVSNGGDPNGGEAHGIGINGIVGANVENSTNGDGANSYGINGTNGIAGANVVNSTDSGNSDIGTQTPNDKGAWFLLLEEFEQENPRQASPNIRDALNNNLQNEKEDPFAAAAEDSEYEDESGQVGHASFYSEAMAKVSFDTLEASINSAIVNSSTNDRTYEAMNKNEILISNPETVVIYGT